MGEKYFIILVCCSNEKMTFRINENQKSNFMKWLKGYESELFEFVYENDSYFLNRINISYVKISQEKTIPLKVSGRF